MSLRRLSNDDAIYELLHKIAVTVRDGNLVLAELSGIPAGKRREALGRIHEITQAADDHAGAIKRQLRENYLTRFDRRLIYRLSEAMRDVVHRQDAVGFAMTSSAFDELPVGVLEMLALLSNQADNTLRMTQRLRAKPDQWEYVDTIETLHLRAVTLQQQVTDVVPGARMGLTFLAAATSLGAAFIRASDGYQSVAAVVAEIALDES